MNVMLTKRSSRISPDDIGRLIVEEQVKRDSNQHKRITIPRSRRAPQKKRSVWR